MKNFNRDYIFTLCKVANMEPWGSELQIAAQNAIYDKTSEHYGIDWEDHTYLLKAETNEACLYVMGVIARCEWIIEAFPDYTPRDAYAYMMKAYRQTDYEMITLRNLDMVLKSDFGIPKIYGRK